MTQTFTDDNFDTMVLKSDKPVLVDFWAQWCGPCRAIGPMIQEIGKEFEGKVAVGKLNVDENPKIAEQYEIRSIPSILFFHKGQIVDQQVGAIPKHVLVDSIEKLI